MFHVSATRDLQWLAEKCGASYSEKARGIEARDERTGRIVGMVGYDSLTYNSAQISLALETPIAWRTLAKPMFEYPFVELKKGVLIGLVSSANARSLRIAAHLGFHATHKIKDAILPSVDLVLFEMRRDECRWLEGK